MVLVKKSLPEILAPAGSMEQVEAAVLYGADAVYLGGDASLRAARPFSGDMLHRARALTKKAGVRLYYCCNAFPRQRGLPKALSSLEEGAAAGADAFIIADPGLLHVARRHFPAMEIHLSTQANTCNAASVQFWQEQGVSRINVARELSLPEVRALRKACPDMELECFVHGAQCLAISGQCLLSAWLNARPANEGQCTQPCRFEYRPMPGMSLAVEEGKRQGEPLWEVTQGAENFSALWAPEDLCLLHFVPWMARVGVAALKIEGRMRGGAYVAHTVDVYREVLRRSLLPKGERGAAGDSAGMLTELALWSRRGLGTGFFAPRHREVAAFLSRGKGGHSPGLARIEAEEAPGRWRVALRGQWRAEESVQLVLPGFARPRIEAGQYALENHRGERAQTLHSGMEGILYCDFPGLREGVYVEAVPSLP